MDELPLQGAASRRVLVRWCLGALYHIVAPRTQNSHFALRDKLRIYPETNIFLSETRFRREWLKRPRKTEI